MPPKSKALTDASVYSEAQRTQKHEDAEVIYSHLMAIEHQRQ